jgi:hypothetical protein
MTYDAVSVVCEVTSLEVLTRADGISSSSKGSVMSPEQELLNIGIGVRRDAGVQNDGEVCLEK